MAHWHESNPWASKLVYVPDLAELAEALVANRRAREPALRYWQEKGQKLDAYVLKDSLGFHAGIRYGAEGSEYLSPYCDEAKLAMLWTKYQQAGAP